MKIVEEYQGGTGRIGRTQDDVITFVPYPGLTTTSMDRLEKDIVVFKKMTSKERMPFFSDARNLKSWGSEEQKYVKNNLHLFASKMACLVDSPLTRFLHNTFLHLYRPEVPVRIFTSKEKAFEWLRE